MGKIKRVGRDFLLLAVMMVVLFAVIDLFRAPQAPAGFADFPLHTIDGKAVTLAELSEDKPLLVYFWASWCSICRFTTPDVAKLSDDGNNVLTVALRSGDDIRVVRYLAGKHLTMPVVNDPQGSMAARWEVGVTPTILIISKGSVVQSTTGWTSYWGLKLRLWWAQKRH